MMDSKTTISIMALAIVAFGIMAATSFVMPGDASAEKSCAAKHWSNCKGDKGWYTEHGHHHCYKTEPDCENYNKD